MKIYFHPDQMEETKKSQGELKYHVNTPVLFPEAGTKKGKVVLCPGKILNTITIAENFKRNATVR